MSKVTYHQRPVKVGLESDGESEGKEGKKGGRGEGGRGGDERGYSPYQS